MCARLALIGLMTAFATRTVGADVDPGQGLPRLVRGNERFGAMLIERIHRAEPERNVVVSPISITITMAMIQNSSWGEETAKETDSVFGWGEHARLAVPS